MVLEPDVRWSSASELASLVIYCKAVTNLALVVAIPSERVLLVAVSSATEAQSPAVAMARLVMASTVSC